MGPSSTSGKDSPPLLGGTPVGNDPITNNGYCDQYGNCHTENPSGDGDDGDNGDDEGDGDPDCGGSGDCTDDDDTVIDITDAIMSAQVVTADGYGPFDGLVPVGADLTFSIHAEAVPRTIASYQWSGGTEYSEYFSSEATRQAERNMSVKTEVNEHESEYSFIVDPVDRTYTIEIDVTFTAQSGGGRGHGEIEFTSIRPDVTLQTYNGQPKLVDNPDGTLSIKYTNDTVLNNPEPENTWPYTAGERIVATVQTHDFGGDFMFLQIATPIRYSSVEYPIFGGTVLWYHQGTSLNTIDNSFSFPGYTSHPKAYGYPIFGADEATEEEQREGERNRTTDVNGWSMNVDDRETHQMGDSPVTAQVSPVYGRTVQVGSLNGGIPEKFNTYVMYKPEHGVWVALARAHWEWGAVYQNTNNGWVAVPFPEYSIANSNQDELDNDYRDEFFPSWEKTTYDVLRTGTKMQTDMRGYHNDWRNYRGWAQD